MASFLVRSAGGRLVHPAPPLDSFSVNLGAGCDLDYVRGGLDPCVSDVEAAFSACLEIPRTMTRFGQAVRRLQGTYGDKPYNFAGGNNYLGPLSGMPRLMQQCLSDASERAERLGHDPCGLRQCHVNLYVGKDAWLSFHQDNEVSCGSGFPIFSYSFYRDCCGDVYRYFVVSRDRGGADRVAELPLFHGDVVVMRGARFQADLWHGCPKTPSSRAPDRLNVTIRFYTA